MLTSKRICTLLLVLAIFLCGMTVPAFADDYDMPYYIDVDITNQIVTIYNTADDSVVRQMMCSSGLNGSTPLGVFYMVENGRASERSEWTWFQQYQCWVKYATRIHLGYMFHSLPFAEKDNNSMIPETANEFGMPTSHGCMRLRVEDAEFIAKNCQVGTRVNIYESGERDEDLRKLLLISSFTGESGMSYSEFLGISEDALGRGSAGDDVLDLQYRLSDLGYFGGELSGKYGTDTIAAVKHIQKDMGLAQNGIASEDFLSVLYSDEAPVSAGSITLVEGKSGPAVSRLQTALQQLGLYSGAMDSIYDLDVIEAVKQFQILAGYEVNGNASPEMQQAMYYAIDEIEQTLGTSDYSAAAKTEEVVMATVEADANINIRKYADTEGEVIGQVESGSTVQVIEVNGEWANIISGEYNGYMHTDYLKPYNQDNVVMTYTASDGASYILGSTLSEKASGAATLAAKFSAYYASEQFMDYANEPVTIVTVNTGSDTVILNLRAQANSDGEILAAVPNGTELRAIAQEQDWTQVSYGVQTGYLMNQYLTFREGIAGELNGGDSAVIEDEVQKIMATVVTEKKGYKARIRESADEDAKALGVLEAGTEVEVLMVHETTGWALIDYEGKQGYILDSQLSFQLMN